MALMDYYEVLGVPRNATNDDIENAYLAIASEGVPTEYFNTVMKARRVLLDPTKRALHDKTIGFPMVIQSQARPYINARCYHLSRLDQMRAVFLAIKEDFKNWILKKTGFDWEEAELAGYNVDLISDVEWPYLILRFAHEDEIVMFAKKLIDERRIKA